jgi:hypothetical protein
MDSLSVFVLGFFFVLILCASCSSYAYCIGISSIVWDVIYPHFKNKD